MAEGRMLKKNKRNNIPYWLKKQVTERDGFLCQICGKEGLRGNAGLAYEYKGYVNPYDGGPKKPIRFEFDHIIPLSSGGRTDERNLQIACRNCNRSKGARMPKCIQ